MLKTIRIVGISHCEFSKEEDSREGLKHLCTVKPVLILQLEPKNVVSCQPAVRVYAENKLVGYVDRNDLPHVLPAVMSQGGLIGFIVKAETERKKGWMFISVDVPDHPAALPTPKAYDWRGWQQGVPSVSLISDEMKVRANEFALRQLLQQHPFDLCAMGEYIGYWTSSVAYDFSLDADSNRKFFQSMLMKEQGTESLCETLTHWEKKRVSPSTSPRLWSYGVSCRRPDG